ncbi:MULTISPECIES: hypothetical protein [unclassified Bacillus (in: firmicutes)]|uniref:hypothetical protein n=1 Tax=unclassified Bacillus (in: firmicutes) TaxID=185979 RepID=UPI000D02E38E|nr:MULTISPECIES: hypothetical protein [unclassified Bacillus (in: firmicutes)]PRS81156.1 hypothetical protein C6346_10135 [Bacillus sp. CJCL2]PRS84165.1 hypothetical protein C6348_14945 [Bacillus sp. YBWC18]
MLKRLMISLCLLLMIGGSVELFAKDFNKRDAEFAAGLNIDVDQLEPFLKHVSSSILDSGLNHQDIKQIQSEIKKIQKDNETKEIGTFEVMYRGEPAKIRVEVEVHVEDINKEVGIYLFSTQELVYILDKELLNIEEKI